MKYYTHLEDYIQKLYTGIGITSPEKLNINVIASKLKIVVLFGSLKSMCYKNIVYIDNRISKEEQWQQFAHELCHVLWHSGNQLGIYPPFREYQEWKANSFAYHFCVPTFMLEEFILPELFSEAISLLQNKFNVTYEFAHIRLNDYLANHYQSSFITLQRPYDIKIH
ncbi:ImmA/IrrE family metallo-endopeptidase [Rummeliibacillus stabekisii]|uniref:ImmA/IrrE family metallo-endopeptidase n=1 Tax=Rummeliibacillus stabekisii TaxID=241244 RepID=UPI00203C37CD|nr:ImmA/IrrE family metallo-endopeptidase [Rummeliibacillus stabekisii]MCM3316144.1 ImmA/IrrE family metallo-endopeptidase [Rummeliibacillus stabekisii]